MDNAKNTQEPEEPFIRIEKQLPDPGLRVMVVCRGYRCYGYRDRNGIWRSHYSGEELANVIGWTF